MQLSSKETKTSLTRLHLQPISIYCRTQQGRDIVTKVPFHHKIIWHHSLNKHMANY